MATTPKTADGQTQRTCDGALDLPVDLAPHNPHHLWLANPVMIASGTFGYDGYGRGITPNMDLGKIGAVIPKTVTRLPTGGKPGTPVESRRHTARPLRMESAYS